VAKVPTYGQPIQATLNVTNVSNKNVRVVAKGEFFANNEAGRVSIYVDTEDFDTPVVLKPGETHDYINKTLADDLIDAGIGWSNDLEIEYVGEVIECNKAGKPRKDNEDAYYKESIDVAINPPGESDDDSDDSGDSGFVGGGGGFAFDFDIPEETGVKQFNLDW